MPTYGVELSDGTVVELEADKQPSEQEVMQYLQSQADKTVMPEMPKVGGPETLLRKVAESSIPSVAAARGAVAGAALGAKIPGPPLVKAIGAGAMGVGGALGAGFGAAWLQHKTAQTIAPKATEEWDIRSAAGSEQHRWYAIAGEILGMATGFKIQPLETGRALISLPAAFRGKLTVAQKKALMATGFQIAFQEGLVTAQSLVEAGRFPTLREAEDALMIASFLGGVRGKEVKAPAPAQQKADQINKAAKAVAAVKQLQKTVEPLKQTGSTVTANAVTEQLTTPPPAPPAPKEPAKKAEAKKPAAKPADTTQPELPVGQDWEAKAKARWLKPEGREWESLTPELKEAFARGAGISVPTTKAKPSTQPELPVQPAKKGEPSEPEIQKQEAGGIPPVEGQPSVAKTEGEAETGATFGPSPGKRLTSEQQGIAADLEVQGHEPAAIAARLGLHEDDVLRALGRSSEIEPETLVSAVVTDPKTGRQVSGPNHPRILRQMGIPGFETRESRNDPKMFGYLTSKNRVVPRGDEAAKIAESAGQKLEEFDIDPTTGEPMPHADQVASPVSPGKTIAESLVPVREAGAATQPELPAKPAEAPKPKAPEPGAIPLGKADERVDQVISGKRPIAIDMPGDEVSPAQLTKASKMGLPTADISLPDGDVIIGHAANQERLTELQDLINTVETPEQWKSKEFRDKLAALIGEPQADALVNKPDYIERAVKVADKAHEGTGLDAPVDLVDKVPPAPGTTGDPFAHQLAWSAGGRVKINKSMLSQLLSKFPRQDHARVLESIFGEEKIHAKAQGLFSNDDFATLWRGLTAAERRSVEESYFGKQREEFRSKFNDSQMGQEYFRRVMQRLMKMEVREVIEAKARGEDWLKEDTLNMFERVMQWLRQHVLPGATSRQLRDMIGKMDSNLMAARGEVEPAGAFAKGMEPRPGDEDELKFTVEPGHIDPATGKPIGGGYIQVDAFKAGKNIWSSNPEALQKLGFKVPSSEELQKMGRGQFTQQQVNEKLGGGAEPAGMFLKGWREATPEEKSEPYYIAPHVYKQAAAGEGVKQLADEFSSRHSVDALRRYAKDELEDALQSDDDLRKAFYNAPSAPLLSQHPAQRLQQLVYAVENKISGGAAPEDIAAYNLFQDKYPEIIATFKDSQNTQRKLMDGFLVGKLMELGLSNEEAKELFSDPDMWWERRSEIWNLDPDLAYFFEKVNELPHRPEYMGEINAEPWQDARDVLPRYLSESTLSEVAEQIVATDMDLDTDILNPKTFSLNPGDPNQVNFITAQHIKDELLSIMREFREMPITKDMSRDDISSALGGYWSGRAIEELTSLYFDRDPSRLISKADEIAQGQRFMFGEGPAMFFKGREGETPEQAAKRLAHLRAMRGKIRKRETGKTGPEQGALDVTGIRPVEERPPVVPGESTLPEKNAPKTPEEHVSRVIDEMIGLQKTRYVAQAGKRKAIIPTFDNVKRWVKENTNYKLGDDQIYQLLNDRLNEVLANASGKDIGELVLRMELSEKAGYVGRGKRNFRVEIPDKMDIHQPYAPIPKPGELPPETEINQAAKQLLEVTGKKITAESISRAAHALKLIHEAAQLEPMMNAAPEFLPKEQYELRKKMTTKQRPATGQLTLTAEGMPAINIIPGTKGVPKYEYDPSKLLTKADFKRKINALRARAQMVMAGQDISLKAMEASVRRDPELGTWGEVVPEEGAERAVFKREDTEIATGEAKVPRAPREPETGAQAWERDKETRFAIAAQNRRTRAISAIIDKALEREQREMPLDRKEIGVDDIHYDSEQAKEDAYIEFSNEESTNVKLLQKVLADAARQNDKDAITVSKRITVLRNKATNDMVLVSTYRDGRKGIYMLDPSGSGSYRPLENIMATWNIHASMLLEHPVQHFLKRFRKVSQYYNELGEDARRQMQQRAYEEEFGRTVAAETELEQSGREREKTFEEELEEAPRGLRLEDVETGEEIQTKQKLPPVGAKPTEYGSVTGGPGRPEFAARTGLSGVMFRKSKEGKTIAINRPLTATEASAPLRWLREMFGDIRSVQDIKDMLRGVEEKAEGSEVLGIKGRAAASTAEATAQQRRAAKPEGRPFRLMKRLPQETEHPIAPGTVSHFGVPRELPGERPTTEVRTKTGLIEQTETLGLPDRPVYRLRGLDFNVVSAIRKMARTILKRENDMRRELNAGQSDPKKRIPFMTQEEALMRTFNEIYNLAKKNEIVTTESDPINPRRQKVTTSYNEAGFTADVMGRYGPPLAEPVSTVRREAASRSIALEQERAKHIAESRTEKFARGEPGAGDLVLGGPHTETTLDPLAGRQYAPSERVEGVEKEVPMPVRGATEGPLAPKALSALRKPEPVEEWGTGLAPAPPPMEVTRPGSREPYVPMTQSVLNEPYVATPLKGPITSIPTTERPLGGKRFSGEPPSIQPPLTEYEKATGMFGPPKRKPAQELRGVERRLYEEWLKSRAGLSPSEYTKDWPESAAAFFKSAQEAKDWGSNKFDEVKTRFGNFWKETSESAGRGMTNIEALRKRRGVVDDIYAYKDAADNAARAYALGSHQAMIAASLVDAPKEMQKRPLDWLKHPTLLFRRMAYMRAADREAAAYRETPWAIMPTMMKTKDGDYVPSRNLLYHLRNQADEGIGIARGEMASNDPKKRRAGEMRLAAAQKLKQVTEFVESKWADPKETIDKRVGKLFDQLDELSLNLENTKARLDDARKNILAGAKRTLKETEADKEMVRKLTADVDKMKRQLALKQEQLKEDAETLKKYTKGEYDAKTGMETRMKRVFDVASQELASELRWELDHGAVVNVRENYLPSYYEGMLFNDNAIHFGPMKILGSEYRKPKTFSSLYAAISARDGPYIPVSLDIADVVAHRISAGRYHGARALFHDILKAMPDPVSKKPIAMSALKIPQPSMASVPEGIDPKVAKQMENQSFWQSPDKDYTLLKQDGRLMTPPIAVRDGFVDVVNSALMNSRIRDNPYGRAVLNVVSALKNGVLLVADTFHFGRLANYALAASKQQYGVPFTKQFGKNVIRAGGGYSAIMWRAEDMPQAVRSGKISQESMDWALEKVTLVDKSGKTPRTETLTRQEILQQFGFGSGLNATSIADAMYREAIRNVPIIGERWHKIVSPVNKFIFDYFTPGIIAETFVRNLERLNAQRPEIPLEILARDIAKDTNFFYGNMGRQGFFKDPTFRDIAQILFLAPLWQEGLIQKDARFLARLPAMAEYGAKQGLKKLGVDVDPTKLWTQKVMGREGLPPGGTIGHGIGTGMVMFFVLAQLINVASRRKFTWQNDEKDGSWGTDAYLPSGHRISPLATFGETIHEVARMSHSEPTLHQALMRIGANRSGPMGRAIHVLATGESGMGQKYTSTGRVLKGAGGELLVAPISFGVWTRHIGHAIAPNWVAPPRPGATLQRTLGAAGLKVQMPMSAQNYMRGIVQNFMREQGLEKHTGWTQVQTDEASYSKLRSAIRSQDRAGALQQIEELTKAHGGDLDAVFKAMEIHTNQPLTGSEGLDEFMYTQLSEADQRKYAEALIEKHDEFNAFTSLVVSGDFPK